MRIQEFENTNRVFSFKVPAGGFDVAGWDALYDSFYPVIFKSPDMAKLLLDYAPNGVQQEKLFMLRTAAGQIT
jgi:hypothetical protein